MASLLGFDWLMVCPVIDAVPAAVIAVIWHSVVLYHGVCRVYRDSKHLVDSAVQRIEALRS